MKQYIITAHDYSDALERRLAVRNEHLAGAKRLKENGNFIKAGALLNADDEMIGSVMMLQFESDEEMLQWKDNDPYVTAKVWEIVDVKSFKVADL